MRALLCIALLLAAACTQSSQGSSQQAPASQNQPRRGGILRVATLGSLPTVLHPYPQPQHNTTPLGDESTLMFSGLIDLDYNTLDYIADPRTSLATALPTISDDGRTFTFTIRGDAKWSDGQPITSADFLFAWQNASNPDNDFVGLDTLERIQSYTAPDSRTIQVTLDQQYARFVAIGTAAGIGPVPMHIWQGKPWYDAQGNPEITKPTVVSGPYMPTELTADHHTYQRNPNWWGKQPNLDQVVFVSATPTTVLELLKTRQVEWAENFPPSQLDDAQSASNANVVRWVGAVGSYRELDFNLQRPQLADKRVREALVRAINRQDLVQFENNLAVPQPGLFPSGNTKWLNMSVESYDYDIYRSRQLLQDAGYHLDSGVLRDPSGNQLTLDIIWPTTSEPRGKEATYIQQQWKQLGINVSVTGLEFAAYVDKFQRQRDFDVGMGSSLAGSPDPDEIKSEIKTGGLQNASGYSNPRVDMLLDQGAIEQDDAKRKAIYDETQKLVTDDLPFFNTITLENVTAFDKKVGGVSPSKGGDILTENNMQ